MFPRCPGARRSPKPSFWAHERLSRTGVVWVTTVSGCVGHLLRCLLAVGSCMLSIEVFLSTLRVAIATHARKDKCKTRTVGGVTPIRIRTHLEKPKTHQSLTQPHGRPCEDCREASTGTLAIYGTRTKTASMGHTALTFRGPKALASTDHGHSTNKNQRILEETHHRNDKTTGLVFGSTRRPAVRSPMV